MNERLEGLLAYMDRLIGAKQYGEHSVTRELNEVIREICKELRLNSNEDYSAVVVEKDREKPCI